MGKVIYDTNIAHCSGRACPIRSKCYRYWLHKHYRDNYMNLNFYIHYFIVKYDFKTEECEMFKPIEQ